MLTLLGPTQRNVLTQFLKVQIVGLPSFQNRFDDVRREECAPEDLADITFRQSLDESSYSALMNGQSADVAFADPPYNVKIDGNVCGKGAIRHREFAMASGEMTEAEFLPS